MRKEISYSGNVLHIGEVQVDLPKNIQNVVQFGDELFVAFELGEMDPRNLISLNYDGEQQWRVPPLKTDADDEPSPVTLIKRSEDELLVFTTDRRYSIDPDSKSIEYLGWWKG